MRAEYNKRCSSSFLGRCRYAGSVVARAFKALLQTFTKCIDYVQVEAVVKARRISFAERIDLGVFAYRACACISVEW